MEHVQTVLGRGVPREESPSEVGATGVKQVLEIYRQMKAGFEKVERSCRFDLGLGESQVMWGGGFWRVLPFRLFLLVSKGNQKEMLPQEKHAFFQWFERETKRRASTQVDPGKSWLRLRE